MIKSSLIDSLRKLHPRYMVKNPVMFVTYIGAILSTLYLIAGQSQAQFGFVLQLSLWLWFTVIFANFSESLAEGRGKARAESLRKNKKDLMAKKLEKGGFCSCSCSYPQKRRRVSL